MARNRIACAWLLGALLLPSTLMAEETPVAAVTPPAAAEALTTEGQVALVGSSPFTKLQFTAKETSYVVEGALTDELRQLSGLTLRLTGTLGALDGLARRFLVTDYEILDCGGGKKPFLGRLALVDGKPVLVLKDAGAPFELDGNRKVVATLAAGAGSRAWVQGELNGTRLRVKTFKVLTARNEP